jgi:hypothetical protein
MPTYLDIILYNDKKMKYIKNKKELKEINKLEKTKETKKEELNIKNIFEENKKNILDSFINYPRLELIKKYKIQTYQFLINKNYRNIFLKCLIIPITLELSYNIFLV